VVTPSPSFWFIRLFLLALMYALSIILRGNNLISVSKHSVLLQSILCLNCSVCLAITLFFVLQYSTSFLFCWTLFHCTFCFPDVYHVIVLTFNHVDYALLFLFTLFLCFLLIVGAFFYLPFQFLPSFSVGFDSFPSY